jgi:hypothetical protein
MQPAIDLDKELPLETGKIDDEGPDGYLPPEAAVLNLPSA